MLQGFRPFHHICFKCKSQSRCNNSCIFENSGLSVQIQMSTGKHSGQRKIEQPKVAFEICIGHI